VHSNHRCQAVPRLIQVLVPDEMSRHGRVQECTGPNQHGAVAARQRDLLIGSPTASNNPPDELRGSEVPLRGWQPTRPAHLPQLASRYVIATGQGDLGKSGSLLSPFVWSAAPA
jgi:hypothetical protein